MTLEEVLQEIDERITHHELCMCVGESVDYHEGAMDALEELRDAIKQKGGEV